MTTQEKISEAKKLLEQYAPKGEFLAYINRDEAKILKDLGGAGIVVEKTGIPSFQWQIFAAVMAATSVMSFMGSMKQMKNMQTASAWDKYHARIDQSYKTIQANKRARLLLSEKRAAQAARGVMIGTGSTLLEQNAVVEELEETKFWINKGVEMEIRNIDFRLGSKLQATAWNAGTSLISNLGGAYTVSKYNVNPAQAGTYSISS